MGGLAPQPRSGPARLPVVQVPAQAQAQVPLSVLAQVAALVPVRLGLSRALETVGPADPFRRGLRRLAMARGCPKQRNTPREIEPHRQQSVESSLNPSRHVPCWYSKIRINQQIRYRNYPSSVYFSSIYSTPGSASRGEPNPSIAPEWRCPRQVRVHSLETCSGAPISIVSGSRRRRFMPHDAA